MSDASEIVRAAIEASRRENRIVHIEADEETHSLLAAKAVDSADSREEIEYWGADWRVHAAI